MQEKQQRLQALIQDLAGHPGLLGAALVSRDGIRVLDAWNRDVWNRETLSAMSATLMGAAEVALAEMGGAKARRVVAEAGRLRLAVVGATDELVVVALADAGAPVERLLDLVESAAEAVTKVAHGE